LRSKFLKIITVILIAISCFVLAVSCKQPDDTPPQEVGDGDTSLLSYSLTYPPYHMSVTGLGSYEGEHLVIPEQYDGWTIEEITTDDGYYDGYVNVAFGNWVKLPTIGSNGCVIKKVSMPDTVTAITKYALCSTNIQEIVIGKNVATVSENAFFGCTMLEKIDVDERNVHFRSIDGNLYSKDGTTLIKYASGKKDAEFTVPSHVTTIAERAFQTNPYLQKVIMGDSVTQIGESAFSRCVSLQTVELSGSLEEIATGLFFECGSLNGVTIPSSVKGISMFAFSVYDYRSGNDSLSDVFFEDNSGWTVSYNGMDENSKAISSTDLEQSTLAQEYLSSTYVEYEWYKNI